MHARVSSSPAWIIGGSIGAAFWTLSAVGAFMSDSPWLPTCFERYDLADTVGSILTVIAAPIPMAGYFLFWGEAGPPCQFLVSRWFTIGFGLSVYSLFGAFVGLFVSRKRRAR